MRRSLTRTVKLLATAGQRALVLLMLTSALIGAGCMPGSAASGQDQIAGLSVTGTLPGARAVDSSGEESLAAATPTSVSTRLAAPATVTPHATVTATRPPAPTFTPSPTPTPTPIGLCSQRMPGDDLLALVTHEYGISRDFAPPDLVLLSDYLPQSVTLGYPTQVRQVVVEPLVAMILDMRAAGLQPQIISGYRSYAAQTIARAKWSDLEPDRVGIISAPPGHSEHQLGTTLDFGSPELAQIVEQEDVEFHTYFYKTSEAQWLMENAHIYGFALSYTRESFALTGMYYEPWHYRYLGPEMAALLRARGLTLSEYLLEHEPPPCIP
jgi:zinc D-Ala-D-Ala carboxypeptidase